MVGCAGWLAGWLVDWCCAVYTEENVQIYSVSKSSFETTRRPRTETETVRDVDLFSQSRCTATAIFGLCPLFFCTFYDSTRIPTRSYGSHWICVCIRVTFDGYKYNGTALLLLLLLLPHFMGCIKIQSISIRSSRRRCSNNAMSLFCSSAALLCLCTHSHSFIDSSRQPASHTDWLLLLLYRILLFHLSERVGEPQPGIIQSSPT